MITLTIPGNPTGKARPRVTRNATYTPPKTVAYETLVQELFIINYPHYKPLETAVAMRITAYFPIPKSYAKWKKLAAERNAIRPTKKPDVDNIQKIIGDALNGLAYKDDSQIVTSEIQKWYTDENPRVEIIIKEVPQC